MIAITQAAKSTKYANFNKNFGARYLNRSVEEQIEYPIADLIINEKLKTKITN